MKENKLFAKVFLWMFLGLFVTGGTSFYVASNPTMLLNIFGTSTYFILILIEFAVVIFLSMRIHKMSAITAGTCFILYSLLTGTTLASILVVYELPSIITMFVFTSILFLIFGLIGFCTKINLSKIGNILFMMLLGVIIVSLINLFMNASLLDIIVCAIGVVVFLGLVAYDIQKIKNMAEITDNENNMAIYGALELYLDFINIFLYLLRLFGKSRD